MHTNDRSLVLMRARGLAIAAALGACSGSPDPAQVVDAALPDVGGPCDPKVAIFRNRCATSGCHDAATKKGGLDLVSSGLEQRLLGAMATGGGRLIDPNDPEQSVLYTKLKSPPPFGLAMPPSEAL